MSEANALSHAYRDIYERFVVETSFLWLLRSMAVNQPHYQITDVSALEIRIQAHLDGLATSPGIAWPLCENALELNGPGEVFTAAIVAFNSHDNEKIQKVISAGFASDEALKGLTSALAWLPTEVSDPWTQQWLASTDVNDNYLAISLASLRRANPGDKLNTLLRRDYCRQHEKLYARCLRLIGELKRRDLAPELDKAMKSENANVAFWAIWSAILLGNKSLAHKLEPYVFSPSPSPFQDRALNMAMRTLSVADARHWIAQLSSDPKNERQVVKAKGMLGDPQAAEWLIEKMHDAQLARLAGEAFTLITGIDLVENHLTQEPPQDRALVPSENPDDDDIAMDEDEKLPWPQADLVDAFWKSARGQFNQGERYLLGKGITEKNMSHLIQEVSQRQRQAAALERALLEPSQIFTNTRAKVA